MGLCLRVSPADDSYLLSAAVAASNDVLGYGKQWSVNLRICFPQVSCDMNLLGGIFLRFCFGESI